MSTVFAPDTDQAQPQIKPDAKLYLQQAPGAGQGEDRNPTAPQAQKDDLEPELQKELLFLVEQFERQSDTFRRPHIRRMLEAEEFWKGNHYNIWDERTSRWYTPFEGGLQSRFDEALPRLDYVTNQYLALGWSTIAAITQKPLHARTEPKSASNEKDIATSKACDAICDLIERNNKMQDKAERMAYLCWTQGGFAGEVRFVRDEDFGVKDEPEYELQTIEIAPDRYMCPQCASEMSANVPQGMGPMWEGNCSTCAYPISDANFQPAEFGQVPVVSGYKKVADGQEVISIHGLITIKVLPAAGEFKSTPYLINAVLQHESKLRAAYPLKADKIGAKGSGSAASGNMSDEYDRRVQAQLVQAPQPHGFFASTSTGLEGMVTYKRAWIRNWGLWSHPKAEIRAKLLAKFPDGCYVAFAEKEFLEARNENPDKFWKMCLALPGEGLYRQGVGDSTISINKRLNDTENIKQEFIEHSAFPTLLGDGRFISAEGWQNRKQEAGSMFLIHPENAGMSVPLQSMIYQPTMRLDGNVYEHGNSLMELGQFVSGAYPSIFGGGMPHNETAHGYAQARDAALGRLQMVWKKVKNFHADIMQIAIECFRENRTEDAELTVLQKSQEYASQYIALEDLQGNITVTLEDDDDWPATIGEVRDYMTQMAQYSPNLFQAITADPANASFTKKYLASPDVIVPGEDSYLKQLRVIDQLLASQPVQGPPQLGPNGPMPGPWIPSIQPDMWIDDHQVCIATNKAWAAEKGLDVKVMNPMGYMNVIANTQMHIQQMMQEQMQLNPPPPPEQGGKPPQKGGKNSPPPKGGGAPQGASAASAH